MEVFFDFRRLGGRDETRLALEQASRLLACYQKALGHDLPNRLVVLQGFARLSEGELELDLRDRQERLANLARRIHEQVSALAQIGRLCRDPGPLEPVLLPEAAAEAAAEVKLLAPRLDAAYDWPTPAPVVWVAREALRQVLVRLLRRAAQAVPGGQSVPVRLRAREVHGGMEVTITDSGPPWVAAGPPERLAELFAGDSADDPEQLDLFLVRQLVADWGGTLRVRTEAGSGTTVTFFVPSAA
jgi:signal transduction histidine kinase